MTPLKLSIFALAASTVARSGLVPPQPTGNLPIKTITQSGEDIHTVQNKVSPVACDVPEPPLVIQKLFKQKQEQNERISSGVNKLVKHLDGIFDTGKRLSADCNHDWWTGYSQAERLEISRIGYAKYGITYKDHMDNELEGMRFKRSFGRFVVCEGVDLYSGALAAKRLNISYKIDGVDFKVQIRCQRGETKLYPIPKNAIGAKAVDPTSPLCDIPLDLENFRETQHHTIYETYSYLVTLFDKLEASKDAQGLFQLAQKVIDNADLTNDVTGLHQGLHQKSYRARRAATQIIEEQETAREWSRVSEAARKRKREREL